MASHLGEGGIRGQTQSQTLQLELEKTLKKKGLTEEDPAVQKLILEFFKENTDAIALIKSHNGKLSPLITQLDQLGVGESKIREFCSAVLQIKKAEGVASSIPIKPPKPEVIPLEFMCDLDAPDHNGAILNRFKNAIASEHPVVTSRALFRAAHMEQDMIRVSQTRGMEKYTIYTNGPLLVFVPKILGERLTKQQRMAKLDLDPNLKEISLADAWTQTKDVPTFKDFTKLFIDCSAPHDMFIHIAGHGGVGRPGGLNEEHYNEFLAWAKPRCKGLLVTSCYVGGESSLLHLPKRGSESVQKFEPKPPDGVSFPVFLHSIGDFPTFTSDTDTRSLFSKLADLLNSPGGSTVAKVRQVLQEEEKGKDKKEDVNLVQVYFPHAADSPGGFRPVGEGGESYPLTFTRYQKESVEEGVIKVSNKAFLELSPEVIECPIEFEGKNPNVLSMIPGQAHHFLQEVKLAEKTPEEFLANQIEFYKKSKVGVPKVLLVNSLKSKEKEFKQVFVNLETGECGYRLRNDYFLWSGVESEPPVKITPFQFMLKGSRIVNQSCPGKEALRYSTGGQQEESQLMDKLAEVAFWGKPKDIYGSYKAILEPGRIERMTADQMRSIIAGWNLTERERTSLLCHLLAYNQGLACTLLKEFNLPPDSEDETGIPMMVHAARNKSAAFIKLLLEKGANPNVQEPKEMVTCLEIAIRDKNHEILDLLLKEDKLDLQVKNKRQNPAFVPAIYDLEALKKCLAKNPQLDFDVELTNKEGKKYSLLEVAIEFSSTEVVEYLLDRGVDPNGKGGEFSPLAKAIIKGDSKMIELLVKHGADPYRKDRGNHYPIAEAMRRSPPEIVTQLLKVPISAKLSKDEHEALLRKIFFSAIRSGEESKIRLAMALGPSFSSDINSSENLDLTDGIDLITTFGKKAILQDIFLQFCKEAAGPPIGIIRTFLTSSPEMVAKHMKGTWDLNEIINELIVRDDISESLTMSLIQKAIDLGADLNKTTGYRDLPLQIALRERNLDLAQFLLEKGADPKKAVQQILRTYDLSFIQFAFKKGVSHVPTDPSQEPPLNYLAQSGLLNRPSVVEIFKWLVEQGADINQMYKETTPFLQVAASGNKELYEFCLAHGGAKALNEVGVVSRLISEAVHGQTSGGEEIVKDLVQKGADLNGDGHKDFCTPFSTIAFRGSLSLVSWCLDQGAKINPENPSFKLIPLQAVASRKDDESRKVFELLVERGGDLNQIGMNESVPIVPIIAKGDRDLVKYCFEHGAQLKDKKLVERAFTRAFESGKPELISDLEQKGYAFSMQDWDVKRTSDFLKEAYNQGGYTLLERAVDFDPSKEGLASAGIDLQNKIIEKDDLKALQLLEAKSGRFDAKEILKTHSFRTLYPPGAKSYDVVIELLGRLEKRVREYLLKHYITDFMTGEHLPMLEFAFKNGVDPNIKIKTWSGEEQNLIFRAIDMGNVEIVKCLLAANPDMSVTFEKKDVLGYARQCEKTNFFIDEKSQKEITKLIQEHLLK